MTPQPTKTVLLAIAIMDEAFAWTPKDANVVPVLTGVGKANAASMLTEAILKHNPVAVVNAGTVGTINYHVGDILVCDRFTDRDLRPLAIHGLVTEIASAASPFPFAAHIDGKSITERQTVSTGDSFVTNACGIEGDAVDMEAFAEAAVCQRHGIPFVAVKYVTDIIGQNSVAHWEEKLVQARQGLHKYFSNYVHLDL